MPAPVRAGTLKAKITQTESFSMRAAAFTAAAVVTAGIYLVLAASLGFAPTVIAVGMVAIAMAAGLGIVLTSAPPSRS